MLSDTEILGYREFEHIIILPFDKRQLGTNSYDVRLGEYFYREQEPDPRAIELYNVYDPDAVKRTWGEPQRAGRLSEAPDWRIGLKNILPDNRVILLGPGETILAHTAEFVGGRDFITTKMYARSSFGRNFIEVCKCAGMGDVGYVNRWTMEVTNNSRWRHIVLVVGMRIAQMTFFKTGTTGDYAKRGGKYQQSSYLNEIVDGWRPEMMLPRLYADWEIRERQ